MSNLEDGAITASELASEFVPVLIIRAEEAGVGAGDAAALRSI